MIWYFSFTILVLARAKRTLPKEQTATGSLIFQNMGVLLQRGDTVALDTDYSMISIFMKFPKPTWNFETCNEHKGLMDLFHDLTDPIIIENYNLYVDLAKSRALTEHGTSKRGAQGTPENHDISKRSILGMLGLGLISTAFR